MELRYPCTGQVAVEGFGAFLQAHLGPPRANLQAFAAELASRWQAPFVSLVNSGSSANLVAALALRERLKQFSRKRAIVSGFTFPTTVSALLLAGFDVELVDVEPRGFNMDPTALERRLADDVGVVCVTHFLGYPAQIERIGLLTRHVGALVLQDACETFDLRIAGQPVHSFGDLTTWSFYHPHHLSSYGGGAIVAQQPELFRIVESTQHWGRECICHLDANVQMVLGGCRAPDGASHQFHYVRSGVNAEMSELNAAFGRFALQRLPTEEQRRLGHAEQLLMLLQEIPGLRVFPCPSGASPFVFPLQVVGKDQCAIDASKLINRLRQSGVEARSWMGGSIGDQPAFRHLPHDGLQQTRALSQSSFFLGVHGTLSSEDVLAVGNIVKREIARVYDDQ